MGTIALCKEINEIITFCSTARNTYLIEDALEDWLRYYSGQSTNLILRLMSCMEDCSPDIKVNQALLHQEYWRVNELPITGKNKALIYAYHLLVAKAERIYRPTLVADGDRTFSTRLTSGQLLTLWQYLSDKGLVSKISLSQFRHVFSGNVYESKSALKLAWLQMYSGGTNISSLLAMIKAICPSEEYQRPKTFFIRVSQLFTGSQGPFTSKRVKSSFYKMNESDRRDIATAELLSFIDKLLQGD